MTITLDELMKHCETMGFSPEVESGVANPTFSLRFDTECYVDEEYDDKEVVVVVQTLYDGECVLVIAPDVVNVKNCKFKGALFAVMAEMSAFTRYLQLTYHRESGAINFEVEIPVMDGTVTAKQFYQAVVCVVVHLDMYYPVIKHAMDTGKIDWDLKYTPNE